MKILNGLTFNLPKQTFLYVFVCFVILHLASVYSFSLLFRAQHDRVRPAKRNREIIQLIKKAKSANSDQLEQNIKKIKLKRGLRLFISPRPFRHGYNAHAFDPIAINHYLKKQKRFVRISIQLSDKKWLRIVAVPPPGFHQQIGVWFIFIALIAALIGLCYMISRLLASPMIVFSAGAKRFANDIDAPPLAIVGPKVMREGVTAFNDMIAKLKAIMHNRTQMLAAISHDLRSPITRLKLRLESVTDKTLQTKMMSDIDDMENMINSILAFARDHIKNEKAENFDLNALLDSITDDMKDAGFPVSYHSSDDRIIYYGRLHALKRAFTNIIENAVKYGKQADVYLERKNNHFEIKVIDQGPGIPEDDMDKVFLPFYRVDTARTPVNAGSGLGLAVTRDIIHACGGDIYLMNRKPQGLQVTISLNDVN